MSSTIPECVSLDTQVFVAAGFNFETKAFQALREHLTSGRLQLVVTDITVREVRAQMKKCVEAELTPQRKFRKEARALRSSTLPGVKAALTKFDEQAIADDLYRNLDGFLEKTGAQMIAVGNVTAAAVFQKYFDVQPPFGSKADKRCEFPDAFAIEALAQWAQMHKQALFVVSGDDLFRKACESCDHLWPKETLEELLDHVASDDSRRAEFIREEAGRRSSEIAAQARREFEELDFWVKGGEDGEVEVTVLDIDQVGAPKILYVGPEEAYVQMTFRAAFEAHLSYTDIAAGIWEDEDGRMMFARHEEDVLSDEDLVVEFDVGFKGTDPGTFRIRNLKTVEPRRGLGIKTSGAADWPK